MASADQPPAPVPEAATGIQPAADSLPAVAPAAAPAAKPPVSPERFARHCRALDVLLVGLVLVFAFLVASFAVRNGDFFRQIATGRLIVQGGYTFGADPFTWGSSDAYWVNHSWLFGLLAYWIYQIPTIGGAAVVVLKALLVTALAEVLMRAGRRYGRPLWVPAACTALAVLVVSPRLLLGPTCVSYLFLGLTLWVLRYPRQVREREAIPLTPHPYRSFWLLPVLFLLWVNFDSYFLLGPILVALYLAGEALRTRLEPDAVGPETPGPGELRALSISLVVGLVACLANPFGVYAFALPEGLGLSAGAEALRDSQAGGYFLSPLAGTYFHPRFGLSVAGLAYFPLLLLSLASFALVAFGPGGRQVVGWRLFTWLPLAILSLATFRFIGFFAVVAGPVTALNLLDFARANTSAAPSPTVRRWALGGRVATLLLVLAAVLATVPGWLQAQPYAARRVAWEVQPDPSQRQAAEQVRTWTEQKPGGLEPRETRWFNLSPEFGNYLAWFAPGERALFDQRFSLFGAVGAEFQTVSQELGQDDPGPAEERAEAGGRMRWRPILRKHGVQFVVVPATTERGKVILARLLSNPAEWVACYLEGTTAIFGWRDPETKASPGGHSKEPDPSALRVDFLRRAFGPQAEQAPETPGRAPEVRPWWAEWWTPPPLADVDGGTAVLHCTRFDALHGWFRHRSIREWQMLQEASAAGLAAGPGGPVLNGNLISLWIFGTFATHELYTRRQDAGPPESLYLALRAARRSLAANPDEPQTHYWLGMAYHSLWRRTRENSLGASLPQLAEVRRTQVAAALNNALKVGAPDVRERWQAHGLLANLYLTAHPEKPYLDLVAKHMRQNLQLRKEMGPLPGEPAKVFLEEVERFEQEVERREREVKTNQNSFVVNSKDKSLRDKVRLARENGLAETALKLVREADRAEVLDPRQGGGPQVSATYLELLLDTGELVEARNALDPGGEPVSRQTQAANLWFQLRLAAASGDYAAADRFLAEAQGMSGTDPRLPVLVAQKVGLILQQEATRATGLHGLTEGRTVALGLILSQEATRSGAVWMPPSLRWQLALGETLQWSFIYLGQLQNQAELRLMRGWLALEAGAIEQAREHLEAAARLAVPAGPMPPDLNARGNAVRALAARYREWLDAARR